MIKMSSEELKVAVTGCTSHAAYGLLFQLGNGRVFGKNQHITLQLIAPQNKKEKLDAVKTEMECAGFPVVSEIIATTDLNEGFKDTDVAFLFETQHKLGSSDHRKTAKKNAIIFRDQGQAINKNAKKTVIVLVIGRFANTNAWLCSECAPDIPRRNFTTLSRLDQIIAEANLAECLKVDVEAIHNVVIWGNCSKTLFPGLRYATVKSPWLWKTAERSVTNAIMDDVWLKTGFLKAVRSHYEKPENFHEVSTARAAAIHMHDLWFGLPHGTWTSMGVVSDGSYGVPQGMFLSFPVTTTSRSWSIVQEYGLEEYEKVMLKNSINELMEEQEEMYDICKIIATSSDDYISLDVSTDISDASSADSEEEVCFRYVDKYDFVQPFVNELFEPLTGYFNVSQLKGTENFVSGLVEGFVDNSMDNRRAREAAEETLGYLIDCIGEEPMNDVQESAINNVTDLLESVIDEIKDHVQEISGNDLIEDVSKLKITDNESREELRQSKDATWRGLKDAEVIRYSLRDISINEMKLEEEEKNNSKHEKHLVENEMRDSGTFRVSEMQATLKHPVSNNLNDVKGTVTMGDGGAVFHKLIDVEMSENGEIVNSNRGENFDERIKSTELVDDLPKEAVEDLMDDSDFT